MKYYVDFLSNKHIKAKQKKNIFNSNIDFRFLSENGLKSMELSRRDDIESLGYFLLFLYHNIDIKGLEMNIKFKENINKFFCLNNTPSFLTRNNSTIDHLCKVT